VVPCPTLRRARAHHHPDSARPAPRGIHGLTGLAGAREFARALLPHAPHAAAFVFDLDLRLCFADGEALRRRDFNPSSLLGRPASEALPSPAWARLQPLYERALAGEHFIVEFEGINARRYRVHGSPVMGPSATIEGGMLVSHEMVTPAEERLTERLRQQSAVAQLGKLAITGGVDLASLIEEAASLVSEALTTDGVGISELLPGGTEFLVRLESSGRLTGQRVTLAGSLPEAVLRARTPLVIDDSEATDHPVSPPLVALGMRSVVCVPIGHIDAPFGMLSVFSRRVGAFAEDDARFLESIAFVLAEAAQREHVDSELRRQALHDVVTGLPNRTLLEDRLLQSLSTAQRAGLRVAVLFVDLDHFKVINDSLGHHAGDQALQAVADRLRSAVRRSDTVARFGGDEFVIVATAIESERDAKRIAETIKSLLAAPVMLAEQQVYVRASIGIALSGPDGDADPHELVRAADAALYRAKARGRGRYELDDASRRPEAASNRVIVEQDLRQALGDGDLRLVFQPFVRLGDRSTFGAEVLLRWQHPEQGQLQPAEFLEVAEQSGLMVPIGAWMLRAACGHAVRWNRREDFLVTVNLSAGQLADPDVVETVRAALESSGLEPERLGLELTEQVLIGDEADAHRTLSELKSLGVKLLLDDFGTGFSSLSHLKRFPIDIVKIDRSFVEGLGTPTGASDAAIVSALVSMSRATGKQVIPEGIETEAQVAALRRLGCECGQGYRFSRPMALADFDACIASCAPAGASS